jgi:hypothetical protein
MEHAPLRPVPSRRSGPAEPATALREVTAALPALAPVEARALALVALAERPRAEVAVTLGIEEAELGAVLARARKELRRTVSVLGGSGWCERAEELISDRLDGALGATGAARLDAHLRNCPRCVEHERRLVQATDWLLAGVPGGAPAPRLPVEPAPRPAESPETTAEEAGPSTEQGAAAPSTEETATGASTDDAASAPSTEETAAGPTSTEVAAAAEVLVAVRTRRQIAAAIAWNSMVALAILLALATIALTIAGILGAEL